MTDEVIGWAVLNEHGDIIGWFKTKELAIGWGQLKSTRVFHIRQAYEPPLIELPKDTITIQATQCKS